MNESYEFHKNITIKNYEKLENMGLVEIDTDCENLPFEIKLTSDGNKIIDEIKNLEIQWNDIVLNDVNDRQKLLELLKDASYKASLINHNHRKQIPSIF